MVANNRCPRVRNNVPHMLEYLFSPPNNLGRSQEEARRLRLTSCPNGRIPGTYPAGITRTRKTKRKLRPGPSILGNVQFPESLYEYQVEHETNVTCDKHMTCHYHKLPFSSQ